MYNGDYVGQRSYMPVQFTGVGIASNALVLPVFNNSMLNDFALFAAQHHADDSAPNATGLSGLINTHSATPAHSRVTGGRFITGSADTQTFTKGAGSYIRLLSLGFRNVKTGIIGTPQQGANTGTGFTIPATTVNEKGSALVGICMIKGTAAGAVLPIVISGLGANAELLANSVNGVPLTCAYFWVPDISAFAGGEVSWTGSFGYAWSAYVIR